MDKDLAGPADAPDVVVIGGGPAGSTVAALLAERGYQVVLLEKGHHPRFHIGESLLPLNMPLFDKLGVADQVAAVGMPKYAAEFVSPWHDGTSVFEFGNALDKSLPYAYQVRRSEFDEILFRNAAAKGARTFEGVRVSEVDFSSAERPCVRARNEAGEALSWSPRFVIDASGRETLLSNQFGIKQRNLKHNSAALFGHFEGAHRNPGRDGGNIMIFWFDHGWFWFIPLADGVTSVGAVCSPSYLRTRKGDPTSFFMETIAKCPALAERLKEARLTAPATATGNYSYSSAHCRGERYVMLGDAFAFVDPVFSSGVFLAMNSAFEGAGAVDAWLRDAADAPARFRRFEHVMRRGPALFSWFIYRVTSPAMRELFMQPSNYFRIQEAILSVLAGDIFRRTPIGPRVLAFKALFYALCLYHWRMTLTNWRKRRRLLAESLKEAPEIGNM
jgi:flavin-dependent dehydrogenase